MSDTFSRTRLVDLAVAATGLDDFGGTEWVEGLDLLLDGFATEARLHELGVDIATGEVVDYLKVRLGVTEHVRRAPETFTTAIERPIVIVGQPRTGTTILFDLLAQDPQLRVPLTWEVELPFPPPTPETYETDPRIAEVDERLGMADLLIPGFTDFHPMGARLGQECVRITAADFKSMIFNTQYRLPTYQQWLLHDADLGSAYRWHRRFLQHLQSQQEPQRWLLKSPGHLWHLEALLAEYPDAVVVQTHRDPLKVIASVSALVAHLRRMASDETSVADAAPGQAEDILLGLDRSVAAHDRGTLSSRNAIDVQFLDFMADPFATIGRLYDSLGLELTVDAERRMREHLAANPGDGGGSGTRYRFADTGLDAEALRERSRRYQERFGVRSEAVA